MTNDQLIDVLVNQNDDLIDYISYRFGDRQFAQEVVQETCLRILQKSENFQDIQNAIAFLKTMCLRIAVDFYRKDQTAQTWVELCEDPQQHALYTHLSKMTSPELQVAKQQREQMLLQAINALPIHYRDVFILTQLYHYPQQQVAEQLNISRGMVARHLAKALKIMRPVLFCHDE